MPHGNILYCMNRILFFHKTDTHSTPFATLHHLCSEWKKVSSHLYTGSLLPYNPLDVSTDLPPSNHPDKQTNRPIPDRYNNIDN